MPKTIQTGESITLSNLKLRSISFEYVDRGDSPVSTLVMLIRYDRVRDDGTVYDSHVVEKSLPLPIKTAIENRWPQEESRCKTDEGI